MQHVYNFWLGRLIAIWFYNLCGVTAQASFDILSFIGTKVNEHFQVSLMYCLLDLFPQFNALLSVMSIISVKLAAFFLTSTFRRKIHSWRCL